MSYNQFILLLGILLGKFIMYQNELETQTTFWEQIFSIDKAIPERTQFEDYAQSYMKIF